jgi:hypothetical protein
MSEAKRPRLEVTLKLGLEAWQCFVRHYSRCYQKKSDSTHVRKDDLIKVTVSQDLIWICYFTGSAFVQKFNLCSTVDISRASIAEQTWQRV